MSTAKTDILFTLGAAEQGSRDWPNYLQYGFEPSDEPALIELLGDSGLHEAAGDSKEVWVPLHAWRTLGQLRSERAIMPLIGLFDALANDDWALQELPTVMGMIGEAALEPLAHYFNQREHDEFARSTAIAGLSEIAQRHPTLRTKVLEHYRHYIQQADDSTPILNGLLVSYLLDMDAKELIDDVRELFTRQCVDISCAGDIEAVEMALGLRLERSTPKPNLYENADLELPDPTPLVRPNGNDLVELLDYYLDHHGGDHAIFGASELDGYFAALACAPQMILPSLWLPALWGGEEHSPHWESTEDFQEFNELIMSFYNDVMEDMNTNQYQAMYMVGDAGGRQYTLVDDWCEGFLRGINLWGPISPADTMALEAALKPIRLFATEDGFGQLAELDDEQIEQRQQTIEPAVRQLFLHFFERRKDPGQSVLRARPQAGRNDPCPCGSGKKYKKCCLH
ncbi:MAG: UPF0149 family protein [Gammaproteobacteria bacterium]|nr:UPF0149 family protein [Gammaproteobacteria bacterium]MBQ0840026.1 UPF0149 family protein [Gammaproteobacteria bacterium]